MREDLAKYYRELADQHSEELAQLLDDFGESQKELLDRLIEIRGGDEPDTIAAFHGPRDGRTSHGDY